MSGSCVSGDYQAVGGSQVVRAEVVDKDGKPLNNVQVKMTVSGANPTTQTSSTHEDGKATFQYSGVHPGDDQISAGLADGSAAALASPAVLHWLNQASNVHPIIWVHGTNEDALDFTTQIHREIGDPDQATDSSEQTFTSFFEALRLKYDPRFIEAMCFVDDRAYDHGSAPSGCRFPLPSRSVFSTACTPGDASHPCESQSSVDENALQLANEVNALSAEANAASPGAGNKVTLIGYSMGGAVIRSFLAGCRAPQPPFNNQRCPGVANKVAQTFYVDGDQQGTWILTIYQGLDAATLSGDSSIPNPITPFSSVLPLLRQVLHDKLINAMGLDLNSQAVADQAPVSNSIQAHDQGSLPPGAQVYNFIGDVRLRLGVTTYGLTIAPDSAALNLGDLLLLAQDDRATFSPVWGGEGLCDGCSPPLDNFRVSAGGGQYYNWVVVDEHDIDLSFVADLLNGTFDLRSEAGKLTNSPVQHLNITQPPIQAPGSQFPVKDITGHGPSTDMSTEIFYLIVQSDGVTLP